MLDQRTGQENGVMHLITYDSEGYIWEFFGIAKIQDGFDFFGD